MNVFVVIDATVRIETKASARRAKDKKKTDVKVELAKQLEARLGTSVFDAVRDAVNDWARDTGLRDHPATTQASLEELELDADEIVKHKGPLNAAATVVGLIGIASHGTTFERRRKGVPPLQDPERGPHFEQDLLRQLRRYRLLLLAIGLDAKTALTEVSRLQGLRWKTRR